MKKIIIACVLIASGILQTTERAERKAVVAQEILEQEESSSAKPQTLQQTVDAFIKQNTDLINTLQTDIKKMLAEHRKKSMASKQDLKPQQEKEILQKALAITYADALKDLSKQEQELLLSQLIDAILSEQLQTNLFLAQTAPSKNILRPLIDDLFKPFLLQTIKGDIQSISSDLYGVIIAIRMADKTDIYHKTGNQWKLSKTITGRESSVRFNENGSVMTVRTKKVIIIYKRTGDQWDPLTVIPETAEELVMSLDGSVIAVRTEKNITIYKRTGDEWKPLMIIPDIAKGLIMNGDGSIIAIQKKLVKKLVIEIYNRTGDQWILFQTIQVPSISGLMYSTWIARNGSVIAAETEQSLYLYNRTGNAWPNKPHRIRMPRGEWAKNNDGSIIVIAKTRPSALEIYRHIGDTWNLAQSINISANLLSMNHDGSIIAARASDKVLVYMRAGDQWILLHTIPQADKVTFLAMAPNSSIIILAFTDKIELYQLPYLNPHNIPENILKTITPAQMNFIQDMNFSYKPGLPFILDEQAQKDFDALFANPPELRTWLMKTFRIKTMQEYVDMLYKRLEPLLNEREKRTFGHLRDPIKKRAWLQKKLQQTAPLKKETVTTDRGDTKRSAAASEAQSETLD